MGLQISKVWSGRWVKKSTKSCQRSNAPIHCFSATMSVYKDIFLYQEGVYSKSQFSGAAPLGYHSVKITGWGQENGVPYWVSTYLVFATYVLKSFLD